MKNTWGNTHVRLHRIGWLSLMLLPGIGARTSQAQEISLQAVVMPSTVIVKDGETVKFAIHGFIEFKSLAEVLPYIEAQTHRWNGEISEEESRQLARRLLREGIESRVVSMADERPLQALVTHTSEELRQGDCSGEGAVAGWIRGGISGGAGEVEAFAETAGALRQ